LTMRRKMNAILDIPYALTQLAEGYVLQGKLDLARTTLLEALELRERNDDAWFEAEILRLLGDVTLASGAHVSTAEEYYRRSLEVAINQGTRSFELRTSVSLARLLSNTDRVSDAIELLTPVRAWFRSQKPTRDTDNADALLASLSGAATAQASAR